jgi:hypothetical protein
MNTITPGNYVRPFVEGLNDPRWDISTPSQQQSAVYSEKIGSRLMSVIGFLNFDRAHSTYVAEADFIDGLNAPQGEFQGQSVDFNFAGFDLQYCNSLQLESAILQTEIPAARQRGIPANGELCGDFVNDALASRVRFLDFGIESSKAGGEGSNTGSIRLKEKGGSKERVIHLQLFDKKDNDYYTFEEFFTLLASRLKLKVEAYYNNVEVFPVEFFIDSRGRFVLAWKIGPLIKAWGGGFYWFQIDMNKETSPMWAIIQNWLTPTKMRRNDVTEGTVSGGDGIEFLLVSRAVEVTEEFQRSTGPVILSCDALTRYQKYDSITPISASGEIAVGVFSSANQLAYAYGTEDETVHLACTVANNSLSSAKINFDPTATLNNFTVKLTTGMNNVLLNDIIHNLLSVAGIGGVDADESKSVSLTLNFRIY